MDFYQLKHLMRIVKHIIQDIKISILKTIKKELIISMCFFFFENNMHHRNNIMQPLILSKFSSF